MATNTKSTTSVVGLSEHIKLRPSEVRECLLTCIRAGEPVIIHGDPGLGKTQIVGQVARELFGEQKGVSEEENERAMSGEDTKYFAKFILSQREPSDALGLPVVREIKNREGELTGQYTTSWARPDIFPKKGEGIFFLDEMPQAVPMLQAPARQLLTERRFGPHQLPDGWHVVAAGNYPHNRAGSNKLLTHVGSAIVHLHVIPHLDDWAKWGVKSGKIRPEVVAFLRFRPALLHDFSTDADTFPCPRTWHKLSNLLDAEPGAGVAHALYGGTVGEGAAGEFLAFLKVWETLPDIDEVLAKPRTAPVPKESEMATMYALAGALSAVATKKTMGAVMTYLQRMPVEYAVYSLRDILTRDESLQEDSQFQQWVTKNEFFLLE